MPLSSTENHEMERKRREISCKYKIYPDSEIVWNVRFVLDRDRDVKLVLEQILPFEYLWKLGPVPGDAKHKDLFQEKHQ